MDYLHIKEDQQTELKVAESKLPSSLFETYSSFANTKGGIVFLGIEEKKPKNIIHGVSNVSNLKKDFFSAIHNPSKVSAPLIDDDAWEEENVNGHTIVSIKIPEAPRSQKPIYLNGNPALCYLRGADGDFLATTFQRRAMELDAIPQKFDSSPNTNGYLFEDLCRETLKDYRALFNASNPDNLLMAQNDKDFFKSIGALKTSTAGELLPTNAAILLFGYYLQIKSIFPEFNLDYRENITKESRWDYRLDASSLSWSGNGFDFFRKSIAHIQSLLPSPFHVEGFQENGGQKLLECVREGLTNAIANCDYLLPGGVVFAYTMQSITFRNAGRMRTPIRQAIIGGESDPRNEGVMNLLHLVKIGEKSGEGIPNVFRIMKSLNYLSPLLYEEAWPSKTSLILLLSPAAKNESESSLISEIFKSLLGRSDGLSVSQLASDLSVSNASVSLVLKNMKQQGIVRDNGKRTKGKLFFLNIK